MQIDYIVCPEIIEEKLSRKHHVTMREVRQALLNSPRIRFAERGYIEGEDVYAAFSHDVWWTIFVCFLYLQTRRKHSDYN